MVSICELPMEVLLMIIDFSTWQEALNLSQINRFFYLFFKNQLIWWYLFQRFEKRELRTKFEGKLNTFLPERPGDKLDLVTLLKGKFELDSEIDWKRLLLDRKKGINPQLRWNLVARFWTIYLENGWLCGPKEKFRWTGQVISLFCQRFWNQNLHYCAEGRGMKARRAISWAKIRMPSGVFRDVTLSTRSGALDELALGDYVTFVGCISNAPIYDRFNPKNFWKFRYAWNWSDPVLESVVFPRELAFDVMIEQIERVSPSELIPKSIIPYLIILIFVPLFASIYPAFLEAVRIVLIILYLIILMGRVYSHAGFWLVLVFEIMALYLNNKTTMPFGLMTWIWLGKLVGSSSPFLWENFIWVFWIPFFTSTGLWLLHDPSYVTVFSHIAYMFFMVPLVVEWKKDRYAFKFRKDVTPLLTFLLTPTFFGIIVYNFTISYTTIVTSFVMKSHARHIISDWFDLCERFWSFQIWKSIGLHFQNFLNVFRTAFGFLEQIIENLIQHAGRGPVRESNSPPPPIPKKPSTPKQKQGNTSIYTKFPSKPKFFP